LLGPLSYAPGLPGGLFAPLLVIGATPSALRAAHANLAVEIQAELPMTWACAQ
jgi:H+/Cl- antiporter ClcA